MRVVRGEASLVLLKPRLGQLDDASRQTDRQTGSRTDFPALLRVTNFLVKAGTSWDPCCSLLAPLPHLQSVSHQGPLSFQKHLSTCPSSPVDLGGHYWGPGLTACLLGPFLSSVLRTSLFPRQPTAPVKRLREPHQTLHESSNIRKKDDSVTMKFRVW